MAWDPYFTCVFADVPQAKTSRFKLIAFVAGFDRHACWFLDYGDYLCLQSGKSVYGPEASPPWMIPELQSSQSPGATIGSFLKALLPI
jgi:hypothetical protein